jgi:acetyl-CoA acyltransferase
VLPILGIPAEADNVNPNGGAIALGHPLVMSGARLALTAAIEIQERKVKQAIATMSSALGRVSRFC